MSCQSWSSVDVTYVHPPQVRVLNIPVQNTNVGNLELGRAVKRYQRVTRTKRGPEETVSGSTLYLSSRPT